MSKTELLEKLALFYYFSFLDEVKAQAATLKTLKKIKIDMISKRRDESDFTVNEFIEVTNGLLERSLKNIKPVSLAYSSGYIILPDRSNWGPWFELRKVINEKDFRALLYSKILKFSEEQIATGLDLPAGTIRYRISRALKALGRICLKGTEKHEHA